MSVDIEVPRLAESISEAVLVEWLKEDGVDVNADEPIATLETDKAAVEIAASDPGVLHHAKQAGDTVTVGDVIARIDVKAVAGDKGKGAKKESRPAAGSATASASAPAPAAAAGAETAGIHMSPSVRRLVEEHRLDPAAIEGTGRGGKLLKEDVLRHVERANGADATTTGASATPSVAPQTSLPSTGAPPIPSASRPAPAKPEPAAPPRRDAVAMPGERVVAMGPIRRRIAERLVHAQQTAAILTTFNEVDMTEVLALRARYKESFERRHGVRLGFMSFFTSACTLAIEEIPELNAEVRGTDIVYKDRVHMGIAVASPKGLVVPVVRDADRLGFPEIEREIARLAARAREGTLTIDELSGGTFTITNGGVFGSLLSTPILNPPQSGILGMHKIEKRPIAIDEQVVIRPMMYVALSYDHRLVDGAQAVRFLVLVKERLEDPERMMLDV